ncbi:MAG: [FeFe] hydrogenase H-cluster radical SAM maturase HydE [Candidatus Gastranaerophilales bacterium]|nr:[FeFe] hydrogenase H-cluster radical SAM maturase HydE [Candidatus Gastranaerophilales bacterium]
MKTLIDKAAETHSLEYKEILALIKDNSENEYLFKKADEVRKQFVGDEVHLRGLIEFSNVCACNCQYCGLQKDNSKVERYKMTVDEIFETAKKAVENGYKTIVLQSGESKVYSIEELCDLIKRIKQLDVAVTLSIGEKNEAEYRALREAGADRYLLRIETTSFKLYRKLHPDMSLSRRMACLTFLKKIGFEIGTGDLIGLPEQTDESIAEDIMFFKEFEADMIGLGPFIPNPDTPLKNEIGGTFEKALKVMAITRLLIPDANIPATTAMETIRPDGRIIALQSGANVVMPNVNETYYRTKYELYPNKKCVNEDADKCRQCIEEKIKSIGRTIGTSQGFRVRHNAK